MKHPLVLGTTLHEWRNTVLVAGQGHTPEAARCRKGHTGLGLVGSNVAVRYRHDDNRHSPATSAAEPTAFRSSIGAIACASDRKDEETTPRYTGRSRLPTWLFCLVNSNTCWQIPHSSCHKFGLANPTADEDSLDSCCAHAQH